MLRTINISIVALCLWCASSAAQSRDGDAFDPISNYIATGDAEGLALWFSDNLELSIFTKSNDFSRSQAKQVMRTFFKSYTPRSFTINHKTGRQNMQYALGTLTAGGEMFNVTIFIGLTDTRYRIQHIKIERIE